MFGIRLNLKHYILHFPQCNLLVTLNHLFCTVKPSAIKLQPPSAEKVQNCVIKTTGGRCLVPWSRRADWSEYSCWNHQNHFWTALQNNKNCDSQSEALEDGDGLGFVGVHMEKWTICSGFISVQRGGPGFWSEGWEEKATGWTDRSFESALKRTDWFSDFGPVWRNRTTGTWQNQWCNRMLAHFSSVTCFPVLVLVLMKDPLC